MTENEREFRVRPGRIRSSRAPKAKSFINQVLRAAQKAGHPADRRGSGARSSSFGRGRISFSRSRLFSPARRVAVKARIARHTGRIFHGAPLATHLAYLKRDGVTREGRKGVMFDAARDRADDAAFAERCKDDRHHFRFIVSPEDAAELSDLTAFTRDLVRQMEADLDTRLDWVAAEHWNTDNPHVHLLVRGVDDKGADLIISRDYISRGLRSRAEDLVSIELGPRPKHKIRHALERDITAERWTKLDVEIRRAADETGYVDLRPETPGPGDPEIRRLMIGRLQRLEKMGLAFAAGADEWIMADKAEPKLQDLAIRGDVIKTMHRTFAERGQDRAIADYSIDVGAPADRIVGRLVGYGLHDELTGEAYAVIDGIDGRAHHVRFQGIETFEYVPPVGGVVEIRRFGGPEDSHPTLVLATRSDLDLNAQVTAPGATWLDHRLVEREALPLSLGGFGREVRDALKARAEHLADIGLARREGQRIILQRELLNSLRRRELDAIGSEISAETGLAYAIAAAGDQVAGAYRRRLILSSGRFAMIDNGLGFQLVPWSPSLEKKLGQHVSGIVKDGGGIGWSIDRKRGLAI